MEHKKENTISKQFVDSIENSTGFLFFNGTDKRKLKNAIVSISENAMKEVDEFIIKVYR